MLDLFCWHQTYGNDVKFDDLSVAVNSYGYVRDNTLNVPELKSKGSCVAIAWAEDQQMTYWLCGSMCKQQYRHMCEWPDY